MGLRTRLETLWDYINVHLEVDYAYLPKSHMDDEDDSSVDEYIQEIKNDFKSMRERGVIKPSSINESIDVLKGLDKI